MLRLALRQLDLSFLPDAAVFVNSGIRTQHVKDELVRKRGIISRFSPIPLQRIDRMKTKNFQLFLVKQMLQVGIGFLAGPQN